ncbi:hypothetical protein ACJJTC_002853 [Scirpophaga incertulas]
MSVKCAGCPNGIKGENFMVCSRCPDRYHYTCLNLTKHDFVNFTKEFKDTWVCPSCRSKEPKRGDNSNTPVRGSAPAPTTLTKAVNSADHNDNANVTLRSKTRTTSTANVAVSSKSCSCMTPEILREIIREELDKKLDTVLSGIQSKLTTIDESLSLLNSEHEQIKVDVEDHKALLKHLERENEQLRNSTKDLSQRLQQLEQLSRSNNLEIQCVPENKNEKLYNTIQHLGKTIKCTITESDIQYCSRIAKQDPRSLRPRSILVKFNNRRLRDTFLAGVINFNRKNPSDKLNTAHLGYAGDKKPVYVSEHLTPESKSLHAASHSLALDKLT